MSDDSLTARNRINQRNFRARRQNYIKELEERLRKYESEGVQATIEIQAAARQAHDQNNKLRHLLIQRYGMSDNAITSYLGFPHQSPIPSGQTPSNIFGSAPYLTALTPAPAPPGIMAPKVPISADATYSYPTPPQQSDPPRTLTSAHLDPALSLASLHRYPSNHEQRPFPEPTPSRRDSDPSAHLSPDTKASSYTTRPPDSPTDTLCESSNPTTPAEQMQIQMQVDNEQHHPPTHPKEPTPTPISNPCCNLNPLGASPHSNPNSCKTPHVSRPNDETSCEEAARIIASMRGGNETSEQDQVMLELGCSDPAARCSVKNLSIFQLMDRT